MLTAWPAPALPRRPGSALVTRQSPREYSSRECPPGEYLSWGALNASSHATFTLRKTITHSSTASTRFATFTMSRGFAKIAMIATTP